MVRRLKPWLTLTKYGVKVSKQKLEKPMSKRAFALSVEDRPRALNIVGEKITVLASKQVTEGYEIFLQEGQEGTGPPPHQHDWDESFFVIEGVIDFGIGDEKMTAQPGTLVHLPAGTIHWFRFGNGGGRMVSMTGEGSDAAAFFTDCDTEIPDGLPDLEKLGAVADRHAVRFS